jgi:hypothetical protein
VNRRSNTYTPCQEQQLRALRMLGGYPDGATALTLLMHAFEKRCITKFVACGYCDREFSPDHPRRRGLSRSAVAFE